MADISRAHDFSAYPPNTPIRGSEVDAELDQLVAGHNAQEDALEILGARKTLLAAAVPVQRDLSAGTYLLAASEESNGLLASGGDVITAAIGPTRPSVLPIRYLDADDFTVTGKLPKLRVRASVSPNGTAPGITFTFGLYPVTFSGAADVLAATLGAVVTDSTAAVASGGAAATSLDFAVPADGLYALGVVSSGALANNSAALLAASLDLRYV